MNQNYIEVIDILVKNKIGNDTFSDIITVQLAKEYPDVFLKIVKGFCLTDEQKFAKSHYNNDHNNYVYTIKACREKYNLGLKEAKDLVDSIRN